MTVVFSTYQSIAAVSEAQTFKPEKGSSYSSTSLSAMRRNRTNRRHLSDEDESAFERVHDNDFIPQKSPLYDRDARSTAMIQEERQESDVYL
jgi:predicted helicase